MLEPKKINLENYYRGSLEKQKADILSNFCFEQVAMIMATPCMPTFKDSTLEVVGYRPWKMFSDEGFTVPNVSTLRKLAERLLDDVIKEVHKNPRSNYQSIATGPFKATYLYGNLTLDFVVESWGNY